MLKKLFLVWCLTGCMLLTACGEDNEVTESVQTEVVQASHRLEAIEKLGKIRIGISPDYAPFAFPVEAGDDALAIAGADVKLGSYIAEGLGVEAEFCEMEFEECLTAVKDGSVDMVLLGMLPKADREMMMDFTSVYYEPGKQVLLVQKGSRADFMNKEAFAGKHIAAQYGTLQAQLVVEQFPESYMELTDDVSGAILKLRMGTVDGVALDMNVAEAVMKAYDNMAVSPVTLDWTPESIVGGVVKDQPELLSKVNEILAQVKAEKLYFQWLEEAHEAAASMPAVR